jgi:hypothetical protein
MKNYISRNLFVLVFSLAGAVGGFLYWRFIGCLSGTCVIKSVWYMSTLYGGIIGYLAGDIIRNVARWITHRRSLMRK